MTNPHALLAMISVGASLLAFQNRELMNKLLLYPYAMSRRSDQLYRLITHAFVHNDWIHLLLNMVALWSFGHFVYNAFEYATALPAMHFYIMYFGAIIFSSLPDLIKHRNNQQFASLGASGAVSAVIMCSILFAPWHLIFIMFIPCPGIIGGVLFIAYSAYISNKSHDDINHYAHLYGAVFGLIYPIFVNPAIYDLFINQLLNPQF